MRTQEHAFAGGEAKPLDWEASALAECGGILLRKLGDRARCLAGQLLDGVSGLGLPAARVVGHYVVDTPPPEERLPMPAVAVTRGGVLVALKYVFGAGRRWSREWTVSVQRPTPYRGPTLGLFDPSLDLRHANVAGLAPELVFGPYRENQAL